MLKFKQNMESFYLLLLPTVFRVGFFKKLFGVLFSQVELLSDQLDRFYLTAVGRTSLKFNRESIIEYLGSAVIKDCSTGVISLTTGSSAATAAVLISAPNATGDHPLLLTNRGWRTVLILSDSASQERKNAISAIRPAGVTLLFDFLTPGVVLASCETVFANNELHHANEM